MFLEFLVAFAQKFLEIVLPVLATALAGLVVAWMTKVINDIKAKLSTEAQWAIEQAVNSAVLAAEQVHLVDLAIDKKDFALNAATEWLEAKGIKFDLAQLDTLIEAAVLTEFNRERAQELRSSEAAE